ncbi:GTPase Era [Pseudomonadota bacterium]
MTDVINDFFSNKGSDDFRCGYAAIVGRPNVGKSTLMNRILGQKVSITSRRPQTTRHRIHGIKTEEKFQAVYVDTPGLHKPGKKAMNRYLNQAAATALQDVDVVVFVVAGTKWTSEDELVLQRLKNSGAPVILAVNQVDRVKKEALLPHLSHLSGLMDFQAIIPVSAKTGESVDSLEKEVQKFLPLNSPLFPEDQVTDRSMRFVAAEIVREKLTRQLGQELPYELTVEIESYEQEEGLVSIGALIWVERSGQKAIVIGKGGKGLKSIGEQARIDLENILDEKVFLQLWVKVKEGWSADERALRSLGYGDE